MINKKEISTVLPYNDIFISCFDNPIYTIASSLGKSTVPFLINNVFMYSNYYFDEESLKDGLVVLNIKRARTIFDIMKDMGIDINGSEKSNDIVGDLKRSIANNKMVFIRVDCFAMPTIPDTVNNTYYYQKNHHPNFFVVYGFDDTSRYFKVVNSVGEITKERQYSYTDLKEGYECYFNNSFAEDKQGYVEIELNSCSELYNNSNKLNNGDYLLTYFNNIIGMKDEINDGLEKLSNLILFFKENIISELDFSTAYKNNCPLLGMRIVNRSKFQYYQHTTLFGDQNEFSTMRKIIAENWQSIRNVLYKYEITKKYNYTSLVEAYNKFTEIYSLEYRYYDWIFNNVDYSDTVKR